MLNAKYKIKRAMYKNKKTELVYKFLRSLKNNGVKETYRKSVKYYKENTKHNLTCNVSLNSNKTEIWKNPNVLEINGTKRCAIFASYSFDKTIPEYVIYYLKKLREVCDYIILVCDNDVLDSEKNKIINLVDYAEFGRHGGYDFNSYKKGYLYLLENDLLNKFDSYILANDSCYGPCFDLDKIIDQMNEKKVDYWGLLDSIDGKYHILSFFYYLNKNVMLSSSLRMFFDNLPTRMSFQEAVDLGEKRFSLELDKEFISDVFLKDFAKENNLSYLAGNRNATVWPVTLLKNRFPLIKVKALTGSYKAELNESISDSLNIIGKENSELYKIILEDLKRRNVEVNNVFDEIATDFLYAIKDAKVVSFDIFDTLLVRPFVEPTDLFEFIEIIQHAPGFKRARIIAEEISRKQHSEEVTFDEIYDCIDKKFFHLHDVELNYEFKLLKPNPAVMNLYRQAVDSGKVVVATSDMYLPKSFLQKVLNNVGYEQIEIVFVSNEKRHTKGNKLIYQDLIEYFGVKASEVVHIGDNLVSDKIMPTELGIKAYCIKKVVERFDTPANTKWIQNYKNNHNICNSIHLSLIARRIFVELDGDKSYWNMLGYRLGGPLVLGYLSFCLDKVKKNEIDQMFFVARDGWSLWRLYQKYFEKFYRIKSNYVYLNRIIGLRALQRWCKQPRYLKRLLELAKEKIDYLQVYDEYIDNINEYKKYEKVIKEIFKDEYSELCNHIQQNTNGCKIALIDTTTGAFSSYNFAKTILQEKLSFALFTGTFINETGYDYYTFSDKKFIGVDYGVLNISELLLSSPEPNIVALKNGKPIYDCDDNMHAEIYSDIFSGIDDYVEDFLDMFGESYSKVLFNFEDWKFLAQNFIVYKNNIDEYAFAKIKHKDLFSESDGKYL